MDPQTELAEQLSDEDAEQLSDTEDGWWCWSNDYTRARIKVGIRLLRPLVRFLLELHIDEDQEFQVRLKQLDDKIEKLVDQDFGQLKILKELSEDFLKITYLHANVSRSKTFPGPELVVRFIDSILQIVQDILHDDEYAEVEKSAMDICIYLKHDILDLRDDLKFLINFIWIIRNWVDVKSLVNITESIALSFTSLCYVFFIQGDKLLATGAFLGTTEEIDTLREMVRKFCDVYRSRELSVINIDTATNIIDEQVVDFFDFLISRLRKLCVSFDSYMVEHVKDQMETAIDELSFLRCNLIDVLQEDQGSVVKEMKSLSISAQSLILETGCLIYESSPFGKKVDHEWRADYWCFGLPELLEAVDSVKQQTSDLYISNEFFSLSGQLSSSPSSSTSQIQFVNTLIKNLEEVVQSTAANSIDPLKCQIQTVYQETVSMRKCFDQIIAGDQLGNSKSLMEFLATLIEQATHQSSNIIDSFLAREGPLWYHKLGLFIVANDIKIVHREMKAILKKMNISGVVCCVSNPASSLADNPTDFNSAVPGPKDTMKGVKMEEATNELVGVKDAAMEVIELLTRGTTRLKIVSIVGMPGLGKTTLANSVYKHPSINIHFHVRAWCCASQAYKRETLLAEILSQFVGETNPSHEVRGKDLTHKLYQNLKGRKYLIVIDDIWDVEVWRDLEETFPDDVNGSRILFTTRHRHVALKAHSLPFALRPLSNEESCELLWFKIFDRETCPPELSNISKRIARKCKGLPLAVVLMAGILKKTERREDSWEEVAETVIQSHSSHEKHLGIMKFTNILELSYKHLPDFLKPCFLYFGVLPQDTSISVSTLIRLWISEGYVQEVTLGKKSLEEEAESYLNELIDRSLVMTARRSSKGGVKRCRIHDVLQYFCSLKFKEERFVLQECKFGGVVLLHGDLEKQMCSFIYHYRSNRATNSPQRNLPKDFINTCFEHKENISERAVFRDNHPIVRGQHSEKVAGNRTNQLGPFNYGLILLYKFLRVLDLGNVRVESSAETHELIMIAKLVHLRYLAIRPHPSKIPSEIGNLRSLETFILTGAIGYIMLPESLWNLVSLQNVVMDHGFFSFQHCSKTFYENFCQQDKLQSISTISLRHGNDVEEFILRRLPGLKKLGCKFFADSWDDSTGCSVFPVLEFLSELESLKLLFSGKVLCPCKFSFPSNLKKLSMSNSRLPWDEISAIGRLPNLEVLKLLNRAFEGQQWDMRDDEFQKLKFLKLDSLHIELWNASAEQLPCLEQLVVLSCPQLEEIPSCFGEICTLQLIEVKWCSSSAMDSVNQILECQRDMSNDQLNVTIVGSA